ncbi:MAG: hypothetical protein SFU25_11175, partial [Candidatus Caenarcaniphilales bacterium]|nr:hypothetical protein [Candidatus Caenarcaniphilales bacterium]
MIVTKIVTRHSQNIIQENILFQKNFLFTIFSFVISLAISLSGLPIFSQTYEQENNQKLIANVSNPNVQVMFLKTFEEKCGQENNIWVGGTDSLHLIKDPNLQEALKIQGIKESHIKDVIFNENKYWITTHNGLYYINPTATNKVTRIDGLQDTIVVKLYFLPGRIIAQDWLKKLFEVNLQSNKAFSIEEINSKSVFQIIDSFPFEGEQEQKYTASIWVLGSNEGGLLRIEKNNPRQIYEYPQLKNVKISSIQQIDDSIWLLTQNDGLYKTTLRDLNNVQFVSGSEGMTIAKLQKINGHTMAVTLNKGIFTFETSSEGETRAEPFVDFLDEQISIVQESDDYIWLVGDFMGQLVRVKRQKKETENISDKTEYLIVNEFQNQKIIAIFPYGGYLWILNTNGNVLRIKEEEPTKVQFMRELQGKRVTAMKLVEGNLVFESFEGAFISLLSNPSAVLPISGLEGKRINAIYFKDGQIWGETYDHSIYRIDPKEMTLAHHVAELQGINIWNILSHQGNYLIASNKGAFIISKNNLNAA